MKFKNKLAIYFVLLLAIFSTGSCAPKDPYIDDAEDDTPLQVYLMFFDVYEKDAIDKYNRAIDDGIIEGRKIEITEFELEELENMYDRLSSEMISGKGPDIIFIDRITDLYLDFTKMSGQDAFADMDILIEKSDTFSFDDYNKAALDAGIIDGKRVMMPLSYSVDYIITTQENMDEINMTVPDTLTFEQFFEIIEKCHNDTDAVGSEYPSREMFYNMISKEGLQEQGIQKLKKYMELEAEDNERYEAMGGASSLADLFQRICNGDILTHYSENINGGTTFLLLGDLYNMTENLYNETFIMMNEPSINPENSYGYINMGCAINMNSIHKNDAFRFVEFLLSESCQYSPTLKMTTLPVNTAAYESAKEDFLNNTFVKYFNGSTTEYAKTPLPDEMKDYFINLVEGVSGYKYIGQQRYIYKHVIGDSIDAYKNGKIDFDTMIEEINRKIKLYYSE